MNGPTPWACNRTEAVLALLLDGDVADATGYGFVDGAGLQDHLRDCRTCQRALRRARRLDAVLASTSGAQLRPARHDAAFDALAVRWFAAVGATAAPAVPPVAGSPARPLRVRWPWLAAAAATAAAALLVTTAGATLHARPAASVATPAFVTAVAATIDMAADAAAPAPLLRAAPGAFTRASRRAGGNQQADAAPAALAERVATPARSADERRRAVDLLLATSRPSAPAPQAAHRALVEALAACGDSSAEERAVHRDLLAALRDARDSMHLLALDVLALDTPGTRLQRADCAVIAVAARIGDAPLDRHLRRVARRHAEAADVVAAALRCDARERGAARLLLDLWHDRAAVHGAAADAPALAWFRGQPATLFTELADELRQSRVAPQRERCLAALGEATDAASAAVLAAVARSNHHDEAHAAAFALAGMPLATLDTIAAVADAQDAWLVRAALAVAEHPAAMPFVATLDLTPAARHRLPHATRADFPVVAAWFREPGGAAD